MDESTHSNGTVVTKASSATGQALATAASSRRYRIGRLSPNNEALQNGYHAPDAALRSVASGLSVGTA